jgi:hypothetical protein
MPSTAISRLKTTVIPKDDGGYVLSPAAEVGNHTLWPGEAGSRRVTGRKDGEVAPMAIGEQMSRSLPDQPETRIELSVPGVDSHLGVIRTVVGRAAMIAGFTFDGIEDFALAIHEAAALLLISSPERVLMSLWSDGDVLFVELHAEGGDGTWPAHDLAEDIRWNLLNSLCDRVWMLEGQVGIGLSQSKR